MRVPSSLPYNPCVDQFLTAEQCLDRLITRLRKRIAALEGVNMPDYSVTIHELRVELDYLIRARRYIANVSSKIPPQ